MFEQAVAWIEGQVQAAGLGPVVRVAPRHVTDRTMVLAVTTEAGELFFKAGVRGAKREAALTAFLARRYHAHMPPVVACDADRGWMLTRAVRGQTLMSTPHVDHWLRAFEALGRLQCTCVDALDDLFELGCRSQTAPVLATRVEAFVAEWCARGFATDDERRQLEVAAPIWKQAYLRTPSTFPDATLDHPDLHPRNIVITAGGPVYLDWDGGAIGHPFWSPLILLGYVERLLPELADARDEMRAAYLQAWTRFLPMANLVETFERLRPLAGLKYAFGLFTMLKRAEPGNEADTLRTTIRACLETALITITGDMT